MSELAAWTTVSRMSPGINIGNTFDNTTTWETGRGNPPITEHYALGFKTVRLPVAWDTYAVDGRIQKKEPASRVRWISAVMKASLSRKMVPVLWDTGHDAEPRPGFARVVQRARQQLNVVAKSARRSRVVEPYAR